MPGLSQLKQFNADLLNLGDEVKIRAARGEKPVTVPIPKNIDFEDDAEDFRAGMPQLSDEEQEQADALAAEREREANDFSDVVGEEAQEDALAAIDADNQTAPDVSDLLAPPVASGIDDLDLGDFENSTPEQEEEPEPEETPLEDMDLDSLLTLSKPVEETALEKNEEDDFQIETPETPYRTGRFAPKEKKESSVPEFSMDDLDLDTLMNQAAEQGTGGAKSESSSQSSVSTPSVSTPSVSASPAGGDSDSPNSDFDMDAENAAFNATSAIDMNAGLPQEFNEIPDVLTESPSIFDAPASDAAVEDSGAATDGKTSDGDDFDLGSVMDGIPDADESSDSAGGDTFSMDSLPDIGDVTSFDGNDASSAPSAADDTPGGGESPNVDETASESADAEGPVTLDGSETPEFTEDDEPLETYDTSAMEDMDFSAPGAVMNNDDFGDSEFEIPDFTEPVVVDQKKGADDSFSKKASVSKANFDDAIEAEEVNKPKNTFTDAEYKRFLKNLSEYPLNLRVAIEDLVVKNDFTDDKVFEILEKVLRKVPARQIASQLDREMEIHVDVPRDFERRTAQEYENYKQTLEYKLKNRIIPFAIMGTLAAILVACIVFLTVTFIWTPLRANHYYKMGYSQIEENHYSQAEDNFNKAVNYKPVLKWFYKYADGYRDHRQYDRARKVYRSALQVFKRDKKSGIDWADMEMNDLYNYEEAERILKREVLDYHINDPDAILKLGDLYLTWADDNDPSKYADAKEQYDLLVTMNQKSKLLDMYYGREMRYFIHVDDLAEVLNYKNMFYPKKMKALEGQDITELSGYLLDKRYGTLRPSEESLRKVIVNVTDLLEMAVRRDGTNPEALYNMGRYYVLTNSGKDAVRMFSGAIEAFKNQTRRTRRQIYTFVNTYRLLGEEYADEREYILAQQTYNEGISLFERENKNSGLSSTGDVGRLYADLGDLNYFINGDMEASLSNYEKSVENKNDSASVRYKIGYIQYTTQDFDAAWNSFVHGNDLDDGQDIHTLLALANTLSLKNDNFAAQGYYEALISILRNNFDKFGIVIPQVRTDHGDMVDTYMKATNNLGVTLSRIAAFNGDSSANGKSIVNFAESSRAWDALNRNQETMIRLTVNDLGKQNSTYVANPNYGYAPVIYTEIPKTLYGEEGLKQ